MLEDWLITILGLWLIFIPFMNFDSGTLRIILLVTGVIVLSIGVYNVYMNSNSPENPDDDNPEEI